MGIDILIIVLLLAIDQIVKYLTVLYLKGQGPKILIDGVFHLQYVENRGAAWGKFQNHTIFLVLITTIVLVFIIYNYFKIPRTKKYLPLRMTILLFMAGAIGNYIDRIRLNYVIDTFYVKLIDFPVFNVADCYIVVGSNNL
jgi:signal peptidase II